MRPFLMRPWRPIVAVALVAAAVAAGTVFTRAGNEPPRAATEEVSHARQLSLAFRHAAQMVLPSVVTIRNVVAAEESRQEMTQPDNPFEGSPFGDLFKDPQFRRFFEQSPSHPRGAQVSSGSGVIIDPSGIILTNNHVVAGGGKVMVRLHDGREFEATEVKTDPKTDLAVVRISGAGTLEAAHLGNSDEVEIGDWVLALGQPFGLEDTVTAGIISAKDRGLGIALREDFLQTDAAINPGNSGGPLVDLDGNIVGINTAISTQSGGYQGVGFAVPSNLARWISEQLMEGGKVERAYLGVAIQPVTQDLAKQFGLTKAEGAAVTEVFPDTPGAEAGLQAGDVVTEFSGHRVASPRELQSLVERAKPGSTEKLTIVRDGKEMTLKVPVKEQPAEYGLARETHHESAREGSAEFKDLGLEVGPLSSEAAEQLGLTGVEGVAITAVHANSPAELAGLTPTMVITQVNRHPVKSVEEFQAALKEHPPEQGLLLLVRTHEGSRFVVLRAEKAG